MKHTALLLFCLLGLLVQSSLATIKCYSCQYKSSGVSTPSSMKSQSNCKFGHFKADEIATKEYTSTLHAYCWVIYAKDGSDTVTMRGGGNPPTTFMGKKTESVSSICDEDLCNFGMKTSLTLPLLLLSIALSFTM